MAMRLTCTGMGTTILGLFVWSEHPVPPPRPGLACTRPALTLFHLARRFWNQIFTCTSESFSACAICERSVSERYFLLWNSFSSSSSCSLVKAVRLRLDFPLPEPHEPNPDPIPTFPSSSGLEQRKALPVASRGSDPGLLATHGSPLLSGLPPWLLSLSGVKLPSLRSP